MLTRYGLLISGRCKACAAQNGSVAGGLEGNLCLASALSAGYGEVLSLGLSGVLSLGTALLASLGLVLETLLCVELLLTRGEYELLAAISALEGDIHVSNFLNAFYFYFIFAHCHFTSL